MKKQNKVSLGIFTFSFLLLTFAFAANVLETVDSTNPNRKTVTTIQASTTQLTSTNCVPLVAISTNGATSGQVISYNGTIPAWTTSTLTKYGTNVFIGADFTVGTSANYTNVMSYTTTLGSNAVVMVNAQMAMRGNGDHQIGRMTDGVIFVDETSDGAALGANSSMHMSHYSIVSTLVSNVTFYLQVKTTSAAGATVYKHGTSGGTGTPTISNATYMTVLEVK